MALKLPYRFLGSTGVKVSTICLGTMTFGKREGSRPGQCDQSTAEVLLDKFVEVGGNFIDTADIYQYGDCEAIIGNWLAKKSDAFRGKLVIATKVRAQMEPSDVNSGGLSRHHIMSAVEASLQRLRTSYIDLYQTHFWDDTTDVEETLLALRDLVRSGKIHYVGISNVTGWQFQKIVDIAREIGLKKIVSIQAQYSLLCRTTEWELLEVCKREGIAMLPWSPLKGGLLSGKFKRGEVPDPSGSRVGWVELDKAKRITQASPSFTQYADKESFWCLLDTMESIAKATGGTVAQVALAWLLRKPAVASVIIGATTLAQLEDNIRAAFLELSEEQLSMLDEKSKEPLPYPYELVFRLQGQRK